MLFMFSCHSIRHMRPYVLHQPNFASQEKLALKEELRKSDVILCIDMMVAANGLYVFLVILHGNRRGKSVFYTSGGRMNAASLDH